MKVLRRSIAAACTSLLLLAPATNAQVPIAVADFSGHAIGSVVHTHLFESSGNRFISAEVAYSGASADSKSLSSSLIGELKRVLHPAQPGKFAYGRGSGFEIGFSKSTPVESSDMVLSGLAEVWAPGAEGPVTNQITLLSNDPLAHAALLRGEAQSDFSPQTCPLGKDLSRGLGYVADAQLVDLDTGPGSGSALEQPLIALDAPNPERAVSQSMSRTALVPQLAADGTVLGPNLGVMSETRQTIAPVTIFKGGGSQFTIEVLGEWVLRAVATGLQGGAYIHYGPAAASPETPVLRVLNSSGVPTNIITLQQWLGAEGLTVPLPGAGQIVIGEDPRAIGGDALSDPVVVGGTAAAAAVDVVRVELLNSESFEAVDLRIGHFEVAADAPAGGILCGLNVAKRANPESVSPGQEFTYFVTVTNPYDCILNNVKVVDTVSTTTGVTYSILSQTPPASSAATNVLTWLDVGPILPGASTELLVKVRVSPDSAGGLFTNHVLATSDCGLDTGQAIVNVNLRGEVTINLPKVSGPTQVLGEVFELPATGLLSEVLAVAAALLIAGGLIMLRMSRSRMAQKPGS